jgi:hypothetical protein
LPAVSASWGSSSITSTASAQPQSRPSRGGNGYDPCGYVTAREPKINEIALRPSNLFVTVDYNRSLIPGVIVMALFMGSMTSGVFNWIMDRFSGVTEAYPVTPLSPWNIASG